MDRVWVAGLPVARAGVSRAIESIWEDARARSPKVYISVNGYSAFLRRDSRAYEQVLRSEWIVPLPDGAPVTAGAWLTGRGSVGRCPGPDLMESSARAAADGGPSFFLLGGDPGVAEELRDALVRRHPGLRVLGTALPSFGEWSEEHSRQLVDQIRQSDSDIVWMGVSAPKQEVWALKWREEIGRPVVCVGAAFDFLSGRKRRAPLWMRRVGLEWVHRLATEPRRLWKRYLLGNPVFLWDLVRYWGRPPD